MKKTKTAGGIVVSENGRIIVVNQGGRSWSLPKGHIEDGENPIDTAKREIYEETGLKNLILVKPLLSYKRHRMGLDGMEDLNELKTIEMFLFRVEGEPELRPVDPDNPEALWLIKEDVAQKLTHPKDKEFFQKIQFEI